jgi:Leucine-rich repeat (LRR) protein
MVLKTQCHLPNIWYKGTKNPFTKGYCTTQADQPDYNTKAKDCHHPKVWVRGNKAAKTKGFCVSPVLKEQKVYSPKASKKSTSPQQDYTYYDDYWRDAPKITLSDLPKLKSYEKIKLYNKDLGTVPDILEKHALEIKGLILNHNHIKSLPSWIGKLKNLEVLDVSENPITVLPKEIQHLKHLKKLVISRTKIQSVPDWLPLSLVDLYTTMKDNQAVCRLLNLKVLWIGYNIPLCIDKLKHLEYLNAKYAKKIPDSVTNLKNLKKVFIMNFEDVVSLPKDIGKLEKLIYISVSGTITDIPESIGNLKNLKTLDVTSIHNRTLPQSILKLNLDKNDDDNERIFELIKKQFPRKNASPKKQKSPTKQKLSLIHI